MTLANLKAVKDQEAEDSWFDDSSEDETYSLYHDGSKPLTGNEDTCLSAWSNNLYGLKDGGSFDEDDDSVILFFGKIKKKGEPIQV